MTARASTSVRWIMAASLLVLAGSVPLLVRNQYVFHLLVISCLWAILALSMELVLGVTGLLSVAHGALFGIGGYTSALLVVRGGMNFWPALALAAMAAGAGGLVIGLPTLRARGPYFVISSLCFGLVVQIIIDKWDAVTFGPLGVTSIPPPSPIPVPGIGLLTFESLTAQYYVILGILVVTVVVVRRVVHSRIGRAFQAIRVNEELAEAVGIAGMRFRLLAFVVSAVIAGVAGSLYAFYITYLHPADAGFLVALNAMLFVVVGGMGSLAGPIIGAFVMTLLPEALRFFEEFRLLLFGLLLIVAIMFFPQGVMGGARAFWAWVARSRQRVAVDA